MDEERESVFSEMQFEAAWRMKAWSGGRDYSQDLGGGMGRDIELEGDRMVAGGNGVGTPGMKCGFHGAIHTCLMALVRGPVPGPC